MKRKKEKFKFTEIKERKMLREYSSSFSNDFLKSLDSSIEDVLKGHYSKSDAKEFLREIEELENGIDNSKIDNEEK